MRYFFTCLSDLINANLPYNNIYNTCCIHLKRLSRKKTSNTLNTHTVFIHNDSTPFAMHYSMSGRQKLRTAKHYPTQPRGQHGRRVVTRSRVHNCCHQLIKFYCTLSNLTALGYFLINSIVFD
jgi:hypothetical protein